MLLALFDVDGTLISTRGAGMRAFYRVLESAYGIKVNGNPILPDGKTDPLIIKELLAYFGLEEKWCNETRDALFSSYLSYLEDEMSRAREQDRIRVLPGVTEILEALSSDPDFCVGLVTGNLETGARIKLTNAGLDHYFKFGGYGSDSEDRTVVTRTAIHRGSQMSAPVPVEGAFVIGDTPLDIQHGHAAGAKAIAVASAKYSMDELKEHSPDLLVPDLTDVQSIIGFMRSRAAGVTILAAEICNN